MAIFICVKFCRGRGIDTNAYNILIKCKLARRLKNKLVSNTLRLLSNFHFDASEISPIKNYIIFEYHGIATNTQRCEKRKNRQPESRRVFEQHAVAHDKMATNWLLAIFDETPVTCTPLPIFTQCLFFFSPQLLTCIHIRTYSAHTQFVRIF